MGFWRDGQIIYADDEYVEGKGFVTTYYGVKDGYMRTEQVTERYGTYSNGYKPDIVRWLKTFGYDFERFDHQFIKKSLLDPFVDKPIEEAEEHIKFLKKRLEKRRENIKRKLELWKGTDELFDGYVIGIDK